MARFIKVADDKGRDHHINVDWIVAFTAAGGDRPHTKILFGGKVPLFGGPETSLVVDVEVGAFAKSVAKLKG